MILILISLVLCQSASCSFLNDDYNDFVIQQSAARGVADKRLADKSDNEEDRIDILANAFAGCKGNKKLSRDQLVKIPLVIQQHIAQFYAGEKVRPIGIPLEIAAYVSRSCADECRTGNRRVDAHTLRYYRLEYALQAKNIDSFNSLVYAVASGRFIWPVIVVNGNIRWAPVKVSPDPYGTFVDKQALARAYNLDPEQRALIRQVFLQEVGAVPKEWPLNIVIADRFSKRVNKLFDTSAPIKIITQSENSKTKFIRNELPNWFCGAAIIAGVISVIFS